MTTKFEDIMADYHKRSGHLIRKAVLIFLFSFVFFFLGMIITASIAPPTRETIEAWRNWKPPAKFYTFALIEYVMLFIWLWLHLNFKLLQTKADFLSDFVVKENSRIVAGKPRLFAPWTELESKSPVPTEMNRKIYWIVLALLLLIRVMSLDRQYVNVVFMLALSAYEITAYFKGRVIEGYLLSLRSNYVDRSVALQIPQKPATMQTSLYRGLILGTVLTACAHFVFQFSNVPNSFFFFFAFCGLCVAAFFLTNANGYFNQIIRLADAVRVQENIEGPDIAPGSNWSIGQELKKDSAHILELVGIKSKRDKMQLLILPILMLLLAIAIWRLFQYVKIHGLN